MNSPDTTVQEGPKMSEVESRTRLWNTYFLNKGQIKEFVEPPLQSACGIFWDKNVRTSGSNANKSNIAKGYPANIILDLLSLSPENKEHVMKLIEKGEAEIVWNDTAVSLKIMMIKEDTTSDEVSRRADEIANSFKDQPPNWVPITLVRSGFYNDNGGFYDEKEKLHYVSKDHMDMIKAHQKKDPSWVPHYSLEQLIRDQLTRDKRVASDFEAYDPRYNEIDFWVKERGYYYDSETALFYLSEQDCLKSNEKGKEERIQDKTSEAVGDTLK